MLTHRNEGEAIRNVSEVKLKILAEPRATNLVNCFNARTNTKVFVRNPKNRFPDAGKLLASLPKPRS